MKHCNFESKRFIGGVLIMGVLLIIVFLPIKTALVFYKENTNQIIAFLPIEKGDTFELIFKHSIHLTDVIEKYVILNNYEIMQYEMIYEQFGIGMPSNAGEGEEFVYEDRKYHIKNLENIFPNIFIRNGKTVSENRLVWGQASSDQRKHMIWFNAYFQPGEWFNLKVNKLSIWQYLNGVKIDE